MATSAEYNKSSGFDGFNPSHLSLGERQNISTRRAGEIQQDVSRCFKPPHWLRGRD